MTEPVPLRWHQTADDQTGEFRSLAGEPNPFAAYPKLGDRGRPRGEYRFDGIASEAEYRLDGFASESELADRVLERLEPWFTIEREVYGTHCCGARLRIDAMLRPRDARLWRNPDVAFGVNSRHPTLRTA